MTDSLDDALRAVATVAELVRDGRLGGIRVQVGELQIDVTGPVPAPVVTNPLVAETATAAQVGADPMADTVAEIGEPASPPTDQAVTAPLMGVFFRAPAPDRPPFVAVAERVEVGQQIAVIEAMKLMNPVLADRAGVVREVLVADGEVVEYEQPLISIEPV